MAATEGAPSHRERSVGELFGELATETSTLVRQEMKLATTEISHKATLVVRQSLTVLGGALIGVASLVAIAGGLTLALGALVPLWGSALIVGAAFAVLAYAVMHAGMTAIKKIDLRPTETIASMQENKLWATKQIQ